MKRQSGIDLIRITGLFFVVGVHQFLYNRFYYEPQVGFWMWSADVWRWLFFCCNCIFMMMSGYLRCNKTELHDCYRGLVPVLVGYTLCCTIIFPVQYLLGERISIMEWITRFVTFGNYAWYIEMHIGLVLISPKKIVFVCLPHLSCLRVFCLIFCCCFFIIGLLSCIFKRAKPWEFSPTS